MTRLPDWEQRLAAYVETMRDRPFERGVNDCILFAAGAIEAMTGTDPAADYRGRYDTREGATAILKAKGEGTLLKTIDAALERRKPSHARRGDLVSFDGSIGVCMGRDAMFVGELHLAEGAEVVMREGLIAIPRRLWVKAWAV